MSRARLQRASEREGLRQDIDYAVLIDQIVGPIYYRILITGAPADREYAERLVDAVLECAITPDATTRDATTPDATTPGATTPGVTTPGVTTPGATTPGATTPDATTPGAITSKEQGE